MGKSFFYLRKSTFVVVEAVSVAGEFGLHAEDHIGPRVRQFALRLTVAVH